MAELIRPHAEAKGDEVALIDERATRTWAELDERVNRWVHALRGVGVQPGDVIALLCGNRCEAFEAMVAAGHAGVRIVPVNWHWTAEELAYVLADSGSRVLIADDRYADVAAEGLAALPEPLAAAVVMRDDAPAGFVGLEEWLAAASADEPDDQRYGGPMFYTSGTTGFPKGVKSSLLEPGMPASIGGLVAGTVCEGLHLPADGVTALCGPLYHSAQWAWSVLPLVMGSRVVMQHRFDPAELLSLFDEHRVTNVHLVPTQFIRLLKLPQDVKDAFDGSSLQVVWHGAAPCSPQVKRDMIEWFGPIIHEYYGGTEGGIISTISSTEWLERPGSVGVPGPTYEIRILDEDGNDQPTGQPGQIWFRQSDGRDFEYHNAPEKTAAAHREGGFGTLGDIGYFDEDGYLYLSDRKIDMIISGGVNIYPAEIEGVLVTHPAVKDAAVFGIPHDEMGEEVKAAVELVDGHEPSDELAAELIRHVREHLAGYKAPRSIDFEDEFPRHPTGKLYKR
ncbi:MAG TPA: AMP-binding protein, partial [Acidimicrobiales bacterium]|nr:AMP-binding protein [Acidimicrobiales bacterium]